MKLYEIIQKYVKTTSITKSIMRLDPSVSQEDLIQELYIKLADKDRDYIYNKMKQCLLQIYNKKKNTKIESCELRHECLNQPQTDMDNVVLAKEIISYLESVDKVAAKCVYLYHIEQKTLREISKSVGLSFNGVKKKIDKGLEIIREHYM